MRRRPLVTELHRRAEPARDELGAHHAGGPPKHDCDIADTDSYEKWIEAGGQDAMMRANAKWKETLRACEPPPLDPSVDEALGECMARKKSSMPDVWH